MDISAHSETWPLKKSFAISRGAKSSVTVVVVEIKEGNATGYGEAVPYPRYHQDVAATLDAIHTIADRHPDNLTRERLRLEYPPNAARNALDCALWDLEAKKSNMPVWRLAGLLAPTPFTGAYSLSLEPPQQLANSARQVNTFPLLKVKLGRHQVIEAVAAVRIACPQARIIVDANEAWDLDLLQRLVPELKKLAVEMIEQPLPAESDACLKDIQCEIPLCADESFHGVEDLHRLVERYEYFNIKLDKTGGLTTALQLATQVVSMGRKVMIGSMMSTSLGLAPAMLLGASAAYVDLDASLWLADDRPYGVRFEQGLLYPVDRRLWG